MRILRSLMAAFIIAALPVQSFAATGSTIDGELGYEKGLYYKSSNGRFKIKQNFRIQFRADVENTNKNNTDTVTDFMIRRLKLKYRGHAYEKWLKWGFQLTASAGQNNREENLEIGDAFIVIAKKNWLDAKLGRHKIPYDREVLNSSSAFQFVDRSIAEGFGIVQARGEGISSGGVLGNLIAYRTGLFQVDDEEFKDRRNILVAGRVQANFGSGELKYSSGGFTAGGDYKISPNFAKVPVFAIGAAGYYYYGDRTNATSVNFLPATGANLDSRSFTPDENKHYGATVDFSAKFSRANVEGAFYYFNEDEFDSRNADLGKDDAPGGTGDDADTEGLVRIKSYDHYAYRIQGGFFINPVIEIATRYAGKSFDRNSGRNDEWAWTSGVNYYIAGHSAKIQIDYTYGSEKNALDANKDLKRNTLRAQLQLSL